MCGLASCRVLPAHPHDTIWDRHDQVLLKQGLYTGSKDNDVSMRVDAEALRVCNHEPCLQPNVCLGVSIPRSKRVLEHRGVRVVHVAGL